MDIISRNQNKKHFGPKSILLRLKPDSSGSGSSSSAVYGIKSEVHDVLAVLMGAYYEDLGFAGKIWLRSKIKNITKHSFEKPISLFLTTRNSQVLESEIGRKWPDKGVVLISDLASDTCKKPWKPGEEIVLTREIDLGSGNFQDNEWKFFEYLTKNLRLPTNEPIKIDKYVTSFCGMSFSSTLKCVSNNYLHKRYKKGKTSNSSYADRN